MSAADVTPAFVAELRKTHEGKQSKLREHHPRGSWAWLALDILDLCDAIESAWAELDRLSAQGVRSRANSRPAPPHPDTVERDLSVEELDAVDALRALGYEDCAKTLHDALRAQAQPTNETRG